MKLNKETQVSQLKNEILNLKRELDVLYKEHNRLQGTIKEISSANDIVKNKPDPFGEGIYRQIVNSANEGIWISDLDLKTIFVNLQMAVMMGYKPEEMIGRVAYDFLDEEGRAISEVNRTKRISGIKEVYEQKYIRKDGSSLWALLSASPLFDETGNVIGILGMLSDITERKKIETALQRSEERYRELVESANSIIIRLDRFGTLLFANKFALNFFGYTKDEFICSNVIMLIPSKELTGRDMTRLIEDIFQNPGDFLQFENENIKKNGERVWISWSNRLIKDEIGNVLEMLAVGNDISERKRIEEEALRRATEIEAVLSCIPSGVIVYDKETRIIRSNSAAECFLNLLENEKKLLFAERFKRHYKTWAEDGRELTYKDLPAFRSAVNGETLRNEIILYHVDNNPRWFNISAAPLIIGGEHSGGVVSMSDITWKKQIEENLRANEAAMEAFFDSSPGILNLLDENYRYINIDRLSPTYYGLTRETMKGKYIKDLSPDFLVRFGEKLNHIVETGEPWLDAEVQSIVPGRPGEVSHWRNSFFSVPLPGGKKGLGLIGIDITQIKRAEEKLSFERELFQGIVDNIPVMITIYDPALQNFRLNKEMQKVTGWTEEDAANGNLVEKVYPDPNYRLKVVDFMKSLKPGWREFIMTAKNGSTIESLWANILLSGGVQIGIGIDIRERRQAEKALKESQQRLQATFNNAAIGIVEVDSTDHFIAVNDRLCEILEYSREELLGKSVQEITYKDDIRTSDIVNGRIHKRDVNMYNYEKRYIKRDGSPVWVHVTVSGVYDSAGNHLNSIGTVEDITERREFEDALRKSEERFRMLADNISQMVFILDNTGMPLWFNQKWYNYTGISLEEMQKDGHILVNHPDHAQRVIKGLSESITAGEPWEDIYPMLGKNKEFRWFLSRALPILNEKGEASVWFGTSTDITEQKIAEEAVKESEERYKTLFKSMDEGYCVFDVRIETDKQLDYYFVEVNEAFEKHTGLKDAQGKWMRSLRPNHEESWFEIYRDVALTGNPIRFEHEGKALDDRWFSLYAFRIGKPEQHRVAVIFNDITERKIAEEAVKESEEKFRSLFENITEGVALFEMEYNNDLPVNYKLLDANPAYSKYTGLKDNLDITQLKKSLFKDKMLYVEEFSKVAQTGQPYKFEVELPKLSKHFIINVISPKKGQFATVLEDITEQKRIEQELKQRNEELTRFIYTVSHDLKSPLVTIKSFTAFLISDIESEDKISQEKDIKYIQNAADKMGNLLDELLELSRIGRKEIPKKEISLQTVAQSAIDLVAGRIAQKKIKINFTGPYVILFGHTQRLIQLYQNLLDNAAKFMGNQSEPVIEIGSYVDEVKNEIVLFVRDNGSGIEPQYHHKIFRLFEKLDNSTEGTGIGLALIKRIVEVHGGSIWFTSEGTGQGTTFYFTLEKTQLK